MKESYIKNKVSYIVDYITGKCVIERMEKERARHELYNKLHQEVLSSNKLFIEHLMRGVDIRIKEILK